MPAAYDLNHSKYTVQKITNEWKKKNLNNNTGEKQWKQKREKQKKTKQKKQKPSATNT